MARKTNTKIISELRDENASLRHQLATARSGASTLREIVGEARLKQLQEQHGSFRQSGTLFTGNETMLEIFSQVLARYVERGEKLEQGGQQLEELQNMFHERGTRIEQASEHIQTLHEICEVHQQRARQLADALADVVLGDTVVHRKPPVSLEDIQKRAKAKVQAARNPEHNAGERA